VLTIVTKGPSPVRRQMSSVFTFLHGGNAMMLPLDRDLLQHVPNLVRASHVHHLSLHLLHDDFGLPRKLKRTGHCLWHEHKPAGT